MPRGCTVPGGNAVAQANQQNGTPRPGFLETFSGNPRTGRTASDGAGIPIVAVVDTNCDPEDADYIIPSNDDAIRAIKLFASKVADAAIEGRHVYDQKIASGEIIKPKEEQSSVVVERKKVFVFKEFGEESVITSGSEKYKHSAKRSRHYRGDALDFRHRFFVWQVKTKVLEELKRRLGKHFVVVLESSHFHIHFAPVYED